VEGVTFFSSLLPLWEKVARMKSAPDEGSLSVERTPHPNALPQGEREFTADAGISVGHFGRDFMHRND
jgi:hypothetical protein